MNAIEFENVSKQYRLGLVGTGTLAHDIRRFFITNILRKEDPYLKIGETNDRTSKGNSDYVWALRDITFNVEQGDVVGIIGKNGAGKSTLLKLLSRVTGPTTGTIRAHGRIGSLLEVGTGFHPEMTGRENIFMNGAILGMTKREIQAKLDEIIDFSGCERYIDTPVKRYSSGMMVRLGFAVAAHLDPEILVVDEVLAVGDAEFQKKAIGKMQDVSKGEGRTVLFVSHNMTSVKSLCSSGVWLENGMVREIGDVNTIVDNYLMSTQPKEYNTFFVDSKNRVNDDSRIYFTDLKLSSTSPTLNQPLSFVISIMNDYKESQELELAMTFRYRETNPVWRIYSRDMGQNVTLTPGLNVITISVEHLPLIAGVYNINLWAGSNRRIIDWVRDCFFLEVRPGCLIEQQIVDGDGYALAMPVSWKIN